MHEFCAYICEKGEQTWGLGKAWSVTPILLCRIWFAFAQPFLCIHSPCKAREWCAFTKITMDVVAELFKPVVPNSSDCATRVSHPRVLLFIEKLRSDAGTNHLTA